MYRCLVCLLSYRLEKLVIFLYKSFTKSKQTAENGSKNDEPFTDGNPKCLGFSF